MERVLRSTCQPTRWPQSEIVGFQAELEAESFSSHKVRTAL